MKLNFFAKIYLAITDFRLYPYVVQKEKFINALAYFICFILLVSAIWSTSIVTQIFNWTKEFVSVYNEKIDDFTISNGLLDMNENVEFEFEMVGISTDDTKTLEEIDVYSIDTDDYLVSIIALKDSLLIGNDEIGFVTAKYSDFNLELTKQNLFNILSNSRNNIAFKISLAFSIFCGVFVAYLLTKFINVLFVSIMLLFLGSIFKTKYKFKHYFEVACYVVTLPIITEIIALVVTGTITEYAYITYYLLIYVYMYYAIRALKLEHIIAAAQERFGWKVENKENNDASENETKQDSQLEEQKEDNDKKE